MYVCIYFNVILSTFSCKYAGALSNVIYKQWKFEEVVDVLQTGLVTLPGKFEVGMEIIHIKTHK